ncbi:MAG: hypothetical protein ACRBF0_23365 [Calditrichia bacterium]
MVKLNLLDLPGQQTAVTTPEAVEETPDLSKSELDFSFFQQEEEVPVAEPSLDLGPQSDPPVAPPRPSANDPRGRYVYDRDDRDPSQAIPNPFNQPQSPTREHSHVFQDDESHGNFEESYASSNWLKYVGIAAAVFALLGLLWWGYTMWSGPGAPDPVDNIVDNTPVVDPNPDNIPDETAASLIPDYVADKYAENATNNVFNVNYAGNFLKAGLAQANYRLLVVTPNYLFMSVLGDTRDDIAEFRQSVKKSYPSVLLTAEAEEDRITDSGQQLMIDFSSPIKERPRRNAATSANEVIKAANVESAIKSLAETHNVDILYNKLLVRGADISNSGFRTRTYYATLHGSQSNTLSYLEDLGQNYPAISISKAGFYPSTGTGRMGRGKIKTRIDLTFSAPN